MAWKNTNPEKIKEYNRKYYQEKTKKKRQDIKAKVIKECPICHTMFHPTTSNNQKYCCEACSIIGNKIRQIMNRKKEGNQEKLRNYQKKYRESEYYKEYRQSEKYKEYQRKYRQEHKEKLKEIAKKYQQS